MLLSTGRKLYSAGEFLSLVKSGQSPEHPLLRKAFIAESIKKVGKAKKSRVYQFTVSTESPDRDHDVIKSDGWRLGNYQKNPVVQWAHDYHELPVGKSLSISSVPGKLISTCEFATKDMNPMAECVYQMVDKGFLNATSVGFNPIKFNLNADRQGMDFSEHELLEYSIVPVPANPEALIHARSAGVDLEPIVKWAEHVLDDWHGEAIIAVPKSSLERVVTMLTGNKSSVQVPGSKGGLSTAPFLPDPTGDLNPDKGKHGDEQDNEDDESTDPGVRGKDGDTEEDDTQAQRRKELEKEADAIAEGKDTDNQSLQDHAIGFAPGDKGHAKPDDEDDDSEDEEDDDPDTNKNSQNEIDDRATNPGSTMTNPSGGNPDAGQVHTEPNWNEDRTNPKKDKDKNAEADDDERSGGVLPVGPKAIAERYGLKLVGEESKRVAICPRGAECPHKANQAIENCPAKRDCPLLMNSRHNPGAGEAIPPGWQTGPNNPRTAIDHDCVAMKSIRRITEKHGSEIQSLLFPKNKWTNATEVVAWLKDHGFSVSLVERSDDYLAIQADADSFESLRTWLLTPKDASLEDCKIKAIGGPRKSGRPFNRDNAASITRAHKHTIAAETFMQRALEHHAMANEHLKGLAEKISSMAGEKSSTGLNPLSSAAEEYDHVRSGEAGIVDVTFHAIDKRYDPADEVIELVASDVAKTYDLDADEVKAMLQQSLSETVLNIVEEETARALNKARGRVE